MKMSVLVPSYKRPQDLARCLAGLARQRRPADQVVIVARRNDHETIDTVKRFAPLFSRHRAPDIVLVDQPGVIHAMCEDYRAGATFDRLLDEADKKASRKISCPVQILWGAKGALPKWYDVLAVWREWAADVRGHALDCGHFVPEEKPAETASALRTFFGAQT